MKSPTIKVALPVWEQHHKHLIVTNNAVFVSRKTALAATLPIYCQYIYFCWLKNKNRSNYSWEKITMQYPESCGEKERDGEYAQAKLAPHQWSGSFTLGRPPWRPFPVFLCRGTWFPALPAGTMEKESQLAPVVSLTAPECHPAEARKALDSETGASGDLQAIWFSVYLGKWMQILIWLLGSVADVEVACKYPFSLPLASCTQLPHEGRLYLQRLR